jgi:aromatic-L-amino-acid decarboxylase
MPDLPPDEFRRIGHQLVDWIAAYQENPERYPVLSRNKPGELMDALPARGPEQPETMDQVLADFERLLLPAITHWNHPGFLAYFATSASAPGILAELLIAGLNANGILWKTSPAVTELEVVVLEWLRQWMGLPAGHFGLIFDTASISSLHAIAAAREMAAPEVRTTGRPEKPLVLYCSEHAHSSIEKAAIALGIGQDNVRKIPSDAAFRMLPAGLEEAIAQDLTQGRKPFCIVATVGTTSTASIDPVPAIVPIARRHGAWLHVDTAYAGSAAVVPEFQSILDGAGEADSIVLNPHKWLFTPMDCSVLYTRRPDILRRAFSLVPEYLRTFDDPRMLNLMEYGIPLGRRFRALKLWFIFRAFGREGLAAIIRDQVAMAAEFGAWVEADGCFELAAPVSLSVVCFRLRGSDAANHKLLDAINAEGSFFISHTALNGRAVLRVAIGNLGTTRETLRHLWSRLQGLGDTLT